MTMAAKRKSDAGLWGTYRSVVEAAFGPAAEAYSTTTVSRLVGFWVTWHLFGGYHALLGMGWSKAIIWKNRRQFVEVFGVPVEDWMPECQGDVVAWRERKVLDRG